LKCGIKLREYEIKKPTIFDGITYEQAKKTNVILIFII